MASPKKPDTKLTKVERRVLSLLVVLLLVGLALSYAKRRHWWLPKTTIDRSDCEELRIDLNTAEQWQLEALPQIGKVKAARIIEYRDRHGAFRSVQELDDVKGIGSAIIEGIEPWLRIGGERAAEGSGE